MVFKNHSFLHLVVVTMYVLVLAWVWMTHSLILHVLSNFFIAFKPKGQIAMMARSHVGEILSMISTLPWSMSWGCQILTLHRNGLSKCVVHTSPHQKTSHNNNQQCKKVKDYWHKCFDLLNYKAFCIESSMFVLNSCNA